MNPASSAECALKSVGKTLSSSIDRETGIRELSADKCVECGKCLDVCPSGTLREDKKGWRILVGGKLGRHPQLGKELAGIYSEEEVLLLVERCLDIYFQYNEAGERFGVILNRIGYELL